MDIDPRQLIDSYLQAMRRGDREAATDYFAEDVVAHFPGRSAHAGTHRGRAAVTGLFDTIVADLDELSIDVIDVLASDQRVTLILRERLRRGDQVLDSERANVYRVEDGKIAELTVYERDQHAVDAFFGTYDAWSPAVIGIAAVVA
jgi:ketosteroid isomerase-like protein